MSAGRPLRLVGGIDVEGWKPALGITPAVQKKLDAAARAIKRAIAATDAAYQESALDSDADLRCDAAIKALDEALDYVEWQPPED